MSDTLASARPGASPEAIMAHYDTGNEVFRLWIGPELIYSCALFEEGDDLARAQIRKLDHHIEAAGAPGTERVLETALRPTLRQARRARTQAPRPAAAGARGGAGASHTAAPIPAPTLHARRRVLVDPARTRRRAWRFGSRTGATTRPRGPTTQ